MAIFSGSLSTPIASVDWVNRKRKRANPFKIGTKASWSYSKIWKKYKTQMSIKMLLLNMISIINPFFSQK